MKKLRTSPSRLQHDLDATIRHISREIGAGVVDAMHRRPDDDQEPGWRAERLASGVLRGIDKGFDEAAVQLRLVHTIDSVVEAALAAGGARAARIREITQNAARAFARGAIEELRSQLGDAGEGPLAQSLAISTRRIATEGASAMTKPLALITVTAGLGLLSVLLLRLRH